MQPSSSRFTEQERMIRISLSRVEIAGNAALAAHREAFARCHLTVFKRFIDPKVLKRVPRLLADADFFTTEHGKKSAPIARELTAPRDSALMNLFSLLLNQERIFAAMEPFANGQSIRCFIGRCYKLPSSGGYFDSWHGDCDGNRRLGLSINLSEAPVSGGQLQVRHRKSGEIQQAPPMEFGDAVLFRIDPELGHRVLPVTGATPKCSFAGWFCGKPGFRDIIQKRPRRE